MLQTLQQKPAATKKKLLTAIVFCIVLTILPIWVFSFKQGFKKKQTVVKKSQTTNTVKTLGDLKTEFTTTFTQIQQTLESLKQQMSQMEKSRLTTEDAMANDKLPILPKSEKKIITNNQDTITK